MANTPEGAPLPIFRAATRRPAAGERTGLGPGLHTTSNHQYRYGTSMATALPTLASCSTARAPVGRAGLDHHCRF
jgi:hypothetical protein